MTSNGTDAGYYVSVERRVGSELTVGVRLGVPRGSLHSHEWGSNHMYLIVIAKTGPYANDMSGV